MRDNIYPPIVDTYQPAFVIGDNCKIYFSLSPYISLEAIASADIQVIINYQANNYSAFKMDIAPLGIIKTNIKTNAEGQYYIEINNNQITNQGFKTNQFYKVQLRFDYTNDSTTKLTAKYINDNKNNFSEWSTVTLIKPIIKPVLNLAGFNNKDDITYFGTNLMELVGSIDFENTLTDKSDSIYSRKNIESEYLMHYDVIIRDTTIGDTFLESKNIYADSYNPNQIVYSIKKEFTPGHSYQLRIHYVTNHYYENDYVKNFYISDVQVDPLKGIQLSIEQDNNGNPIGEWQYGRTKLTIANTSEGFLGNIILKRSSNKTNFAEWEDLKILQLKSTEDIIYYDTTIESGVWYKYGLQKINNKNFRSSISNITKPVMTEFESAFLISEQGLLRLKYDVSVSSYKHNILESKTDTLGSQYAFFKRNGNVNYKSFSLSGLITGMMDIEEQNKYTKVVTEDGEAINQWSGIKDKVFFNLENFLQDEEVKDQYRTYLGSTSYDFVMEKNFRDKVIEFLYADDIKLFKSASEGNILVKLMDINFTPNEGLGRLTYSFTATAYEIDEPTIDNLEKYNIHTVGNVERVYGSDVRLLQINQYDKFSFKNTRNLVEKELQKYHAKNKYGKIINIKWLRITVDTDRVVPHKKLGDTSSSYPIGYPFRVGSEDIIISQRGIYEVNADGIDIGSNIYPLFDCNQVTTSKIPLFTIDILAEIRYTDTKKEINTMSIRKTIGQESGVFLPTQSPLSTARVKNWINKNDFARYINNIARLDIEADYGVIVNITQSDGFTSQHEVNKNNRLVLNETDITIQDMEFVGIKLTKIPESHITTDGLANRPIEPYHFIIPPNPNTQKNVVNGVYKLNNGVKEKMEKYFDSVSATLTHTQKNKLDKFLAEKLDMSKENINKCIYYHGQFFPFEQISTTEGIVYCPMDAYVNYICETIEERY